MDTETFKWKEPRPLRSGALCVMIVISRQIRLFVVSVSGGAENVDDFVLVESGHAVTSRSEVLSRVELSRFVVEDFTDAGGHGKTGIGVDVDLADSGLCGFAEFFFRDADSSLESAAVGVDDINFFLRNGGGTVENDREARELLFDGVEDVECERRRNEAAGLRVDGALFGFELVCAVGGADGDREGVDAGLGDEVDDFFRLGVVGDFGSNFIFNAREDAEFAFDGDAELVSEIADLLGQGDVLVVRKSGAVDHDGGEAEFDAALAELEGITVVEVEADRDGAFAFADLFGVFDRALSHVAEEGLVRVVASAFGNLEDHRGFHFRASGDDRLELFHVVEVERRDRIVALHGFCEHVFGVDKTEVFVIYHLVIPFVWQVDNEHE